MAKAEITIAWLPLRAAAGYVASYLGCSEENARLRINRKVEAGRVRARGVTSKGHPVSLLSTSWRGIDWDAESLKLELTIVQLSYEVTNVELCYADLVATELLTTTALGLAWWSAAEALAWIIIGVPLEWKEWAGLPELARHMEEVGIVLGEAIGADQVLARGRLSPLGQAESLPGSELRIPGFVWVVCPDGTLGTSPPGRLTVFLIAQHEQGLKERRWYGIEVDSARLRQAFPRPPVEPARRGPPEQYDWDEGFQFMRRELDKRGDPVNPTNAVEGWRSDADVARLVAAHIAIDDQQPDLKHTARVIRLKLKEWRAEQAEHN